MPLFEFKCKACGDKFEELVTSKTEVKCPNCHSGEVGKVVSTFGFRSSGGAAASGGGCSSCAGGSCASCH
ncbi:MAG: zinc ribbon domain-containing protein [Firmicutes bacterium]|nr:zinc ribbon domain-containing protein [Bacillota bacterium]